MARAKSKQSRTKMKRRIRHGIKVKKLKQRIKELKAAKSAGR